MIDTADAVGSKSDFAGLAFRQRDERGDILDRKRRTGLHHQRRFRQQHDRREIAHRVVGQLGVDGGICALRTHRADQQRVAVRSRLSDRRCAEYAAGAAFIIDDDWLAECGAELRRDDAGYHVDGAARGERHNNLDDLVGITLRAGWQNVEDRQQHRAKGAGDRSETDWPKMQLRGDHAAPLPA
jgi:hypothetical protein